MRDLPAIVEEHAVYLTRVDVERASLVRVPQHLHNAGQVVVRQIAGEAGIGLVEHLCRLKAFSFQRIAQPLCKIDVAVDEKNLYWTPSGDHGRASTPCGVALSASACSGPGVSTSRFNTSITSPSCDSHPATCGASDSPADIISALINSHSPVTGTATHSLWAP